MENKRKLFREYKVFVNGRLFEISHTAERKQEIVNLLSDDFGADAVTVENYNHFESGYERAKLERIIAEQKEFYRENGIYVRHNNK